MAIPFEIIIKIFWSLWVSLGFAVLFNTPKRALWAVGLLGAVGYGIKIFLLHYVLHGQIVLCTLIGASAVGLLGVYFAHRVHTPPITFTIPAVINMVPGKYGYLFVIGLLKLVTYDRNSTDFHDVMEILNNGLVAGFSILSLAFGVIISILIFNTSSVKHTDPHHFINKRLRHTKMRRFKKQSKNI